MLEKTWQEAGQDGPQVIEINLLKHGELDIGLRNSWLSLAADHGRTLGIEYQAKNTSTGVAVAFLNSADAETLLNAIESDLKISIERRSDPGKIRINTSTKSQAAEDDDEENNSHKASLLERYGLRRKVEEPEQEEPEKSEAQSYIEDRAKELLERYGSGRSTSEADRQEELTRSHRDSGRDDDFDLSR